MAFNRDNRSGGGRDFGRDKQMFKAVCSNCGKECEVPFKPTGGKPVYCSDCFRTMRASNSRSTYDRGSRKPNFDNNNRGSSYPQYKEQFEAINAKLDKILTLLNPDKSIEASKVAIVPQVKKELIKVDIKPLKNEASRSKAARNQSGIPPKPTPHFAKASLGVPLAPSSLKQIFDSEIAQTRGALRYSAKGKKTKAKKLATPSSDIPVK